MTIKDAMNLVLARSKDPDLPVKFRWLLDPEPIKQSLADIFSHERNVRLAEKEGISKAELTVLWMDLVNKKNIYKQLTSLLYDSLGDLKSREKHAIRQLFLNLDGFTWRALGVGWIGQSAAMNRLGLDSMECPVPLFRGIKTENAASSDDTIVTAVCLSGQGCQGTLSNSVVSGITGCLTIDLSLNLISSVLPKNLCQLVKLEKLFLQGNLFHGGFLDESILSNLTQLVSLDCSFNGLQGAIPDSFQSLPSLTAINLSGNYFSGEIPDSLGNLNNLKELKLQGNQLTGAIPISFGRLHCIKHINLSLNRLTTGVNVFNSCQLLEVLQIQDNLITGHLDGESIGGMHSLRILYIQKNRLSGILPTQIGRLRKLRFLNCSSNNFRGLLPEEIGLLSLLESLLLHDNLFIGPAPASLKNLKGLRDFTCFRDAPAEFSGSNRAFNPDRYFRVFQWGPQVGVNSAYFSFDQLYGRPREEEDNESVTIFSGKL